VINGKRKPESWEKRTLEDSGFLGESKICQLAKKNKQAVTG